MDRKIGRTPCVGIKLPDKPPASALQVLSTDEIMTLAETVPASDRALILCGAGT
jgi:hypothetical protein